MKRIIVLGICLGLLTACFHSKEAKEIKNSKASRTEIETAIKETAKEKYGMDVKVRMSKLKFAFPQGKNMLMKTDKRLEVPVETVGEPRYQFKIYMPIYNPELDKYEFNKNELELKEFTKMGRVLLTEIYEDLYEEKLNKIIDFDEGVELEPRVDARFNRYFEDEKEENSLLKSFGEDYNAGKFENPEEYPLLIKKHAELPNEESLLYEEQIKADPPCTPEIKVSIAYKETEAQQIEEKLAAFVEFIKHETSLPNGSYYIHINEEEPENTYDRKSEHEIVLRCES